MARNEFEAGYVCAVATMLKQHDEPAMATDALHAYGHIDWRNVEAYDRKVLKDAGLRLADFTRQGVASRNEP